MTRTTCFNTRKALPAKMYNAFLGLVLLLCCALPFKDTYAQKTAPQPTVALKQNRTYKGKSIKVDDGDTFTFLSRRKVSYRIRLDGIDAPEKGMPYAKKAKEYLAALLLNQEIELRVMSADRYGRYVGKVYCNGKEVSLLMLEAGYAWHYSKYNQDAAFSEAEHSAHEQRNGLWQDKDPLAPWTVRAYRRAGYSDVQFNQLRKQNSPEIRKFLQTI